MTLTNYERDVAQEWFSKRKDWGEDFLAKEFGFACPKCNNTKFNWRVGSLNKEEKIHCSNCKHEWVRC